MENELREVDTTKIEMIPINQIELQVKSIQTLMKSILKEDEHYGKIPGVNKPFLFKAGAEKLCFAFRLSPEIITIIKDLDNGHREYISKCSLRHIQSNNIIAIASGSCSTMEEKYRWRDDLEITGQPFPDDYKFNKDKYRQQGFIGKKIDGQWAWCKIIGKKENENIADSWNTCLKMSEKRALLAVTLMGTAASDIFNQDEDFRSNNKPSNTNQNGNNQSVPKPMTNQPSDDEIIKMCDTIASYNSNDQNQKIIDQIDKFDRCYNWCKERNDFVPLVNNFNLVMEQIKKLG